MRIRIAWVLAGLTAVLALLDVVVTAQYRALLSEDAIAQHGFPFVTGAVMGSAALGAVILSRGDRHPIGWLLVLIGFTGSLSLLAEAYSIWVVSAGGPGSRSVGGVSGWVSSLIGGQLAIAGLALMFLLAPDGHLLSRRWRWATGAIGAGVLGTTIALLSINPATFDLAQQDVGPVRQVAFTVGFVLITVGVLASGVSMVLRLRRSDGEQRQQLRLIAAGALLIVFGIISLFVVQAVNGGRQTWAASLPLYIGLLPVADPVRRRRPALPALRRRGDPQPGGGAGDRDGVRGGRLHPARGNGRRPAGAPAPAASGSRCWVPRPSRSPSSHFGAAWSARRTGWRTGLEPSPTRSWPSSTAGWPRPPPPDALLPAVAQAAARAVSARGAVVTMAVSGIEPLSAQWGRARRTQPTCRSCRSVTAARPRPHRGVPAARRWAPALRRPPPGGARRPGRRRLPQHRPRDPAGRARGRARPHHPPDRRVPRSDRRGRRRRTPNSRGGDRSRRGAVPGSAGR